MASHQMQYSQESGMYSPSMLENVELPWRKRVPFDLVARGVAGVDEMAEYCEDDHVYFGVVNIEIGTGSFQRQKSVFIHFNGEHMKPMQRAKANKKKAAAQKLLSPYHAELVLENVKQCSIDYLFSKLKHIFVADSASKGTTKFEIGSLKEEYKKKMKEAKKKAQAEKERLEQQRAKLLAQQEEEKRMVEEAKRQKEEEEERKRKEAEEEARRQAEEEERRRKEEEEAKRKADEEEAERVRVEQEEAAKQAAEEERKKKEEEEAKKKKKKKKIKRRKKDDWSDDREWTGERIVKCIHAQTSPMNWAVFKPSASEVIPMAFGHGDLNDLRAALKPDQVQYGIMRLTFGEGRFRRSHWVFVCWSPDSMTKVESQKLRKQRMSDRMNHIGFKGWMQKAIGPYGVEVLAESYEFVTLEDWILRVRKTVVVDGADELMNAEAFQKALEAEKKHFEERKRKQEEEKKKKEALENKLKKDEESSSEEEVFDKDEQAKNRKKRKRKKKEQGDEEEEEEEEEEAEDAETKEEETESKEEAAPTEEEKTEENENENEKEEDDKYKTELLSVDVAQTQATKRKSSVNPQELKRRDVSSQLCYESITLVKRGDSDLVWVLIEPRLRGKK
eukprot:CAMPEP_0197028038 /NCGR_PEP_ID=MMETSP1384-20130603/7842_1 /TAXON_ID=29189 /ORGANISM="Ammonia sp." /LENGTH=616 /DNA_ID=CAMNT_0042456979 /DNA_START=66 /DNA_END=1916 /DNA_ORIENTATION=-